ncbi:hypothetical protein DRJ48_05140 [Candidatus Woesearchaeota archaeon]|nr:MAG: hypothetical protein DRJ48_05140 [Candidatus Woesearchaeota archaeon]
MKRDVCIVLGILLFLLILPIAAAGSFVISPLLEPYARISIADLYLRYANLVDFFIVFVIFGGVAKFALSDKYGESSKGVALVAGLMLALAFAFFEKKYNFNFGNLGWLALVVFVSFIVFFLYSLMREFGAGARFSVAILFVIIYGLVGAFFPQAFEWLNENAQRSFGVALMQLVLHVALITAVIKIIISIVTFKNKID